LPRATSEQNKKKMASISDLFERAFLSKFFSILLHKTEKKKESANNQIMQRMLEK
jgi:hypothetical protein